jgi:hypothetical protein
MLPLPGRHDPEDTTTFSCTGRNTTVDHAAGQTCKSCAASRSIFEARLRRGAGAGKSASPRLSGEGRMTGSSIRFVLEESH